MASSASHTNPFSRPPGRIPSDSSSGDSSWSHHHRHWPPYPPDMVQPFTPEMRDRQARGKDPYLPEADDPPHLADRPARGRGGPMAAMSTIGMPGPAPSRSVSPGQVASPFLGAVSPYQIRGLLMVSVTSQATQGALPKDGAA